ncbi:MAG: class I SAM-dependent methyltransferase [Proteobacteria bacterium]|nr:class I SAM-dependent methyltransferase [Pseudomonadota bacterium]
MKNPWCGIPLSDYEGHMDLPTVGQASLIADEFARVIECYRPSSAAMLGCAGGNGLNRVAGSTVRRLVAVDINPDYVAATHARYRNHIDGLEVIVADVQNDAQVFEPVGLVFAALLLEYVDLQRSLQFVRQHCQSGGIFVALLQLPSAHIAEVTPSPYVSLQDLSSIMRLVPPAQLRQQTADAGFVHITSKSVAASGGKSFAVEHFQKDRLS